MRVALTWGQTAIPPDATIVVWHGYELHCQDNTWMVHGDEGETITTVKLYLTDENMWRATIIASIPGGCVAGTGEDRRPSLALATALTDVHRRHSYPIMDRRFEVMEKPPEPVAVTAGVQHNPHATFIWRGILLKPKPPLFDRLTRDDLNTRAFLEWRFTRTDETVPFRSVILKWDDGGWSSSLIVSNAEFHTVRYYTNDPLFALEFVLRSSMNYGESHRLISWVNSTSSREDRSTWWERLMG